MGWMKRRKEKLVNEKQEEEVIRGKIAFQESGILKKMEKRKDESFLLSLLAMFHRTIG